MSDFVPGLVTGVLLGAAIGALAVAGLARTLFQLTGTRTAAQLLRFLWSGLLPGRRRDAVAVERALSRVLKEQYSVLASGTRVAATSVVLRISPEDHEVLQSGLGVQAAVADLTAFTVSHATASGWQVAAEPVLTIERDISLKPRQVRAQSALRIPPSEQDAERRRPTGPTPVARSGTGRGPSAPDETPAAPTLVLHDLLRSDEGTEGTAATEVLGFGNVTVRAPGVVHVLPRGLTRAVLGRGGHCDVRVTGPGVAEEHAALELRGNDWWLVPLARDARTTLGGDRIAEPARLGSVTFVGLGHLIRLEVVVEPLAA